MNAPTLLALPGAEDLARALAERLGAARAALDYRRFPDGESYLRIDAELPGEVALVARLDHPDSKIPALLFAAELARERGARRLGLVCPYLPYMRQDRRFQPGEALTSASFADWISERFDWLVTVDPHLHRYRSLNDIYRLEAQSLSASAALAEWIATESDRPVIIGPDEESAQWVETVAAPGDWPWAVMRKVRRGDRDVTIHPPDLEHLTDRSPVLVDDIASSGHTLAEAVRALTSAGLPAPACAIVHGLFGEGCRATLRAAGIRTIVCTDSVRVPEARILLAPLLADGVHLICNPGSD